MQSKVIKGLRRALAFVLSYGIVFSYPTWTVFTRVAYADAPESGKPATPAKQAPKPKPTETPPATGKHTNKDKDHIYVDGSNDCGEKNFYVQYTKKQVYPIDTGDDLCGDNTLTAGPVTYKCWQQVYTLLGAADANAYYLQNKKADPEKTTAASVAMENSFITMENFTPTLRGEFKKRDSSVNQYLSTLQSMSDPKKISNSDHKECCMKLVAQARKVGEHIKTNKRGKDSEYKLKDKDASKLDKLFADHEAKCNGKPIVAAAKKEKKTNWWLIGGLIALFIAAMIWIFSKKKKKVSKPKRPRKPEKPCKKGKCRPGEITGGENNGGTPGGTPGGAALTGVNDGDGPGRGNQVQTGTATGVDDGDGPGRGNSTGESATVTGSTNATTSDPTAGNQTGATNLDQPVDGGDGPTRGGDQAGRTEDDSLTPAKRTLIK